VTYLPRPDLAGRCELVSGSGSHSGSLGEGPPHDEPCSLSVSKDQERTGLSYEEPLYPECGDAAGYTRGGGKEKKEIFFLIFLLFSSPPCFLALLAMDENRSLTQSRPARRALARSQAGFAPAEHAAS
jgi:hypothetical protein